MSDLKTRKAELDAIITLANSFDEKGQHALADQLTKFAKKEVEQAEDDVDADDAESPVDNSDPFAKGFGRSLATIAAKINRICDSNNCHKKLEALCGTKCDSDEVYNQLRKLNKLLKALVG